MLVDHAFPKPGGTYTYTHTKLQPPTSNLRFKPTATVHCYHSAAEPKPASHLGHKPVSWLLQSIHGACHATKLRTSLPMTTTIINTNTTTHRVIA